MGDIFPAGSSSSREGDEGAGEENERGLSEAAIRRGQEHQRWVQTGEGNYTKSGTCIIK